MTNIGVAFEIFLKGQLAPNSWKKVTGHLVFDVKMGSLGRPDGYLTGIRLLTFADPPMPVWYPGKAFISPSHTLH